MSEYDYANDLDYENCTHERIAIFRVDTEWEIDSVSIIIECKDCHRVGLVDGRLDYDENEIRWGD